MNDNGIRPNPRVATNAYATYDLGPTANKHAIFYNRGPYMTTGLNRVRANGYLMKDCDVLPYPSSLTNENPMKAMRKYRRACDFRTKANRGAKRSEILIIQSGLDFRLPYL